MGKMPFGIILRLTLGSVGVIFVRSVEDAKIISNVSDETGSDDDMRKEDSPKTYSPEAI